ncbi:MAG: tRNA (cytosine(32)/uridine(32)-2'-O)-methyltransferase TrmJ [Gammaproteobacteria bacterium]|nr:tRNA (cytosine(32)/uridine(32)-2'-O)-methyltransferase TrmJ [Gammaproteobacteria bacterium]MDH5593196.1 tRNA (cytosine(32)/uridine(32)-2'-O)-methyltransferase TrmJ [Gammaproteobacteria bacterium]MDH5613726.1 tRNA (cytosine(32)/uridine(32)-2'-O)-methyltransferase TrmJ [Gammaproteobacteria bacterium]
MLSNIRIVLIETSHPGNIGATARAMKNMCLENLVLVNPRLFPHADATSRASGADDVLARATVCTTLDEALQDCNLVLGTSARSQRRLSWPEVDSRQCGELVANTAQREKVAIVFGRENSGLTNEELERCHYLVHIPCNPEFSSLNIAAAVQLVSSDIFQASQRAEEMDEAEEIEYVTAAEMDGFYTHLEQTLIDVDFLNPDHPRKLMRRLRRLFNRARMEKTELNILRGILTEVNRKLTKK